MSLSTRFPAAESWRSAWKLTDRPSPLAHVGIVEIRPRGRRDQRISSIASTSRTRAGVMAGEHHRDEHASVSSAETECRSPALTAIEHVTVALVGGWVGDPAQIR